MAIKTFNPTPRLEEPDRRGRWINPQDFEKEHGYDYTDDPNFDSRADAGGAVDPTDTPTMLSTKSLGGGESQQRASGSTVAGGGAVRRNIEKKKTLLTSKAN